MVQNAPVPSPAGAGSHMSNMNLLSPGSVGATSSQSPGAIIAPSPALQSVGAPSPGSVLNTPGTVTVSNNSCANQIYSVFSGVD